MQVIDLLYIYYIHIYDVYTHILKNVHFKLAGAECCLSEPEGDWLRFCFSVITRMRCSLISSLINTIINK